MSAATTLLKPFLRHHKVLIGASVATGFLNNSISMLLTLAIGQFFDDAYSYTTNKGRILSLLGWHLQKDLLHFFIFFAGLIVVKLIVGWADIFLTAVTGEKLVKQVREQLFQAQLHQAYEQFQQKDTGKYLLRYSGDMRSIQNMLTRGVIGYTKELLFVFTGLFFLIRLQPLLAAIFIFLALSLALLTMIFDNRLKRMAEQKRDKQSSLLSFVTTRLLALRSVKAFNKEPVESDRFNRRSEIIYVLARQYHLISGFIQASAPVVLYTSLALVLGITTTFSPPVKGGVLLSYVLLTILLFPPLRKIIKARTTWQSGNLSAKKLQEILNGPVLEQGLAQLKGNILSIQIQQSNAEIAGDSKQQPGTKMLLPGQLHFLNHEQGYSLLQFITGMATSRLGSILINGIDINNFSIKSVRRKVAVSADAFSLYGNSVYDASVYTKKPEKRKQLIQLLQALQFSGDHTDIDRPIGMQGNQLRPGEKKILMHARALLTNKPVLIFEDPFSGLSVLQVQCIKSILLQRSRHSFIIIVADDGGHFLTVGNGFFKEPALS
jgi:ABC-type multidrug transport system fused ATPase/permease subunit